MKPFKFVPKDNLSRLPKTPGVYAFKDKAGILYIGKATNIKERTKNHFGKSNFRDNLFIDEVKRVGYIKTDYEIEALILEANLIKKYQPKYNVVWRDDKNYFFIGMTKEDFPKIFITHQPSKVLSIKYQVSRKKHKKTLNTNYLIPNTHFVGPFVDGKALKQALGYLQKVLPWRACPENQKRPCLWYQLGRCCGPCTLKSEAAKQIPSFYSQIKKGCQSSAKNILNIFRGRKTQVLKDLKKEMKLFSGTQDFEKAARIRDQIGALERVLAHAKVFETLPIEEARYKDLEKTLKELLKTKKNIERIEAYDVSNIQGKLATGAMVTFLKGRANKNFYRKFKIRFSNRPDDIKMLKEVLERRFRHAEWGLPDAILIDGGRAQLNVALRCKLQIADCKLIKVMAIAKKENKLYIENRKKPILLKNLPREIFNLVLQLRDESHRFAITYHQKLRVRDLLPE